MQLFLRTLSCYGCRVLSVTSSQCDKPHFQFSRMHHKGRKFIAVSLRITVILVLVFLVASYAEINLQIQCLFVVIRVTVQLVTPCVITQHPIVIKLLHVRLGGFSRENNSCDTQCLVSRSTVFGLLRFCERLRRSALYFVLLQNTPQLEVQSLCFFFCGRPGARALLQIF